MFTRRIATAVVARVAQLVHAYWDWLTAGDRTRREARLRSAAVSRTGDGAGVTRPRAADAAGGPGTDRLLSDAVEDLIQRLDFATIAELRSAVHLLDTVLRDPARIEGRRVLEGLADLVEAEANHHEATIDRELATMLRSFPDGR